MGFKGHQGALLNASKPNEIGNNSGIISLFVLLKENGWIPWVWPPLLTSCFRCYNEREACLILKNYSDKILSSTLMSSIQSKIRNSIWFDIFCGMFDIYTWRFDEATRQEVSTKWNGW